VKSFTGSKKNIPRLPLASKPKPQPMAQKRRLHPKKKTMATSLIKQKLKFLKP